MTRIRSSNDWMRREVGIWEMDWLRENVGMGDGVGGAGVEEIGECEERWKDGEVADWLSEVILEV